MNTGELVALFRAEIGDVEHPYVWSDAEVYAYANDAYTMFVRLRGGVSDFTSDDTAIRVVAGQPYAEISDKILRIMSARRRSDGRDVAIINGADLDRRYSVHPLSSVSTPGPVKEMVIGLEPGIVRWVQTPVADDIVDIHVYRLPSSGLTGPTSALADIDPMHHLHLTKWMKSLAYAKADADTFNRTRAEENDKAFREYCGMVEREWNRAKHKTRVVAYGGI